MKPFISLFAVIAAGALFAEKQPLERYQAIIDRRPFGQPPPGYDPDSTVLDTASAAAGGGALTPEELSQEQAELQRAVGFSMMNINTDGSVSVGFTDASVPGAPKSYYMREHETREGWTVKSVDIYEQTATFEKDGVEVTLKLGATAKNDAKGGARGANRGAGMTSGRSSLLGGGSNRFGNGDGMMSHASRRARREQEAAAAERARVEQEAERKRREEESAAKEAEEKAAREAEREATRQQLQALQEALRQQRDEARQQRADQEKGDENDES